MNRFEACENYGFCPSDKYLATGLAKRKGIDFNRDGVVDNSTSKYSEEIRDFNNDNRINYDDWKVLESNFEKIEFELFIERSKVPSLYKTNLPFRISVDKYYEEYKQRQKEEKPLSFFTGTVDGLGENIAGMIIGLKHLYLSSDKIVSRSPYKYGPMRVFGTFILMGGKMLANLPEGIYHSFKSIGQRSINAFSGELNMSQAGKNVGGFLFEIGNMLLLGKGVAQIVKSGSTTVAFTSGTSGGSALVLAGVEIPALGVVGAGVAKVGLAGAGIFKTEAGQPIGPAHINPSEIIENLYKKAQDSWREYMADLNTKGWRSKAPEWTRRFIRVKPTPKKMQAWLEEFKKAETPGDLMRQTDCIDITQRGSQRLLNILIEGPLEITRSPELLASMKKIVKNNPDLYLMLKNNKAACLAGYARAIEKGWADLAKALNDRIGLYSDLGL